MGKAREMFFSDTRNQQYYTYIIAFQRPQSIYYIKHTYDFDWFINSVEVPFLSACDDMSHIDMYKYICVRTCAWFEQKWIVANVRYMHREQKDVESIHVNPISISNWPNVVTKRTERERQRTKLIWMISVFVWQMAYLNMDILIWILSHALISAPTEISDLHEMKNK